MDSKLCVLTTLSYSDIFDYPLTADEIDRWLISNKRLSKSAVSKTIDKMVGKEIILSGEFICLKGREKIFEIRRKRLLISQNKLQLAKQAINFLSRIPSIQLLAISGSLARLNAEEEADIDLFIVTTPRTLWITRLLVLIYLQLIGKRRKRNEQVAADKICVNYLIDSKHLAFEKNRQDVYTAYEICQLKVIFQRNKVYEQFIQSNSWLYKLLPNWKPDLISTIRTKYEFIMTLFFVLEPIVRWLQIRKIRRHQTSETIQEGIAEFHPRDYRVKVMKSFNLTYGTLTNT